MHRIFLLFLATIFISSAKPDEIDSLIKTLPLLTDKYEKAVTLNNICLKLVYVEPDSALAFGKQALALGKSENDNMIIGKSFNRIGIVYDVKNVWDSALIYYDSALFYGSKALDSVTIASAYNNIGLVYWNMSLFDKAIDNFFKSLVLFEKLDKKIGVANTYNNIGLILMDQGRDSAALQYQVSGLKIQEELGDVNGIYDSRLNIALIYMSTKQLDSSAFYYRNIIPFYLESSNHYALGTAFNGLAMVYDYKKELDSAMFYYDKAIAEHMMVQNLTKAASSYLSKAGIYRQTGHLDLEFETLLKGLDLANRETTTRVRSKILFQLAENYYKKGMYKKAADLYLEFKAIKDSLYNVDRDEKIEQIKVQYETEKKEKALLKEKAENERLAKEKALAEIRVYNRNKWIIGISSVGFIIIFFLLFVSQRSRRKAQAEKDAAIIEEREKGIKAIFDAQEEERKRIAKDLHDGIGQQVSAIKMFFQGLSQSFVRENPELKDDVDKIAKMITDAGTDVRTISHQMMPRALTELGLVEAMEDMVDKSFSKSTIDCNFEHYNIEERLPQHVEIGLYRIAQELLNNIIKHSNALKVDVQLMKMKNHCILIVQDDGKGLSDDKSGGIGMMNINNRLRSLNGEMNMESASGKGTTATIRIALG